MESIGIRELKAHLSRQLKLVRAGTRLLVTERGRAVAIIGPADADESLDWVHRLVAQGKAQWRGGKPRVVRKAPILRGEKTAAAIVIEDRG